MRIDELSDRDFKSALKGAYICSGGMSAFAREIEEYTRSEPVYTITRNVLSKINQFKLTPQKRYSIERFLESKGYYYNDQKGLFDIPKNDPSSPVVDNAQFTGKFVIIYDLYQGDNSSEDSRRMLCAYMKIEIKPNSNELTGVYQNYKWGNNERLRSSENGVLNVETTRERSPYIKVTPVIKTRTDVTMPVFQFCLDDDGDIRYLRGIAVGYNDRKRDEMVAVRAVGLPEDQVPIGRVPYIEKATTSSRLWDSLSAILHGKHSLDRDGVINMGASHLGERTVYHIESIRGAFLKNR